MPPVHQEENCVLDKSPFAWILAALIVFSVICFSLETLPYISATARTFLHYAEVFVVVIFSAEYLYRVYSAPNRLRFIFSFYGLVDLLAILPFYLSWAIDLRTLRMLRLLRLIRIIKLARYSRAMGRFSKALYMAKEELVIFTLVSLILFFLSAVGIYHFEHSAQPEVFRSIFDSLWWAVATLTTVGYGDIYPITVGGRLFTFGVLMIGLGLVAVPAGVVASALSAVRRKQERSGEDGK